MALALMCIMPYTAKSDTILSERIYILSSIWKEISNNFAFHEKFKETNLDSLYRCYLTKVLCRKLTGVFGINEGDAWGKTDSALTAAMNMLKGRKQHNTQASTRNADMIMPYII